MQHAEEAIRTRWQEIELTEARLTAAQDETKAIRESLLAKQHEQDEAAHAERLQLALERRRLMAEIAQKRHTIERRSEHLDKCRTSLTQMRAELAHIHQETLETRLATEELWVQMAGDSPAAALVESLARTRAKLAEHYSVVQEEIQQKKNELLAIRAEMTHEHRRLVKRKHRFDQWAQGCQKENEEMARRLVAKEKEINRREAQMADEVHAWEIERIEYQQAIRYLLAHPTEPEGAAA